MTLRIYSTLTNRVEEFIPRNESSVDLFVCGPTVYDFSHAGHAKTYTQFDFIARYLKRHYSEVNYLLNITDIDDKIIARAIERNITSSELAEQYEKLFLEDMTWLGNTSVTEVAHATDYIPQIVDQIERLIEVGAAYQLDDGWYFDLSTQPAYGKLSGRVTLQDEDAVSRIDDNSNKRNIGDFALWKAAKPGEPFWQTKLGNGRPGWHIEDTAITEAVFGPQYDIHGGAVDLIFPHHEAEIAQMETASGQIPLAKYWMHTGLLRVDGARMGKSMNNFITIRDLKDQHDFRTLRYVLLSRHYRSSAELTDEAFVGALSNRERVENFYRHATSEKETNQAIASIEKAKAEFYSHLDNDLNTPDAFATLFTFIRESNRNEIAHGATARKFLDEINDLFVIFDFSQGMSINANVEGLIAKRNKLRASKQFAEADIIRKQLSEMGVTLEDTKEGTLWTLL